MTKYFQIPKKLDMRIAYKYTKGRNIFHDAIVYLSLIYNKRVSMTRSFLLQGGLQKNLCFPLYINQ